MIRAPGHGTPLDFARGRRDMKRQDMQDIHIIITGLIAGTCTTASFVPQIVKILKTGHTRDISLYMYIVLTTGIFLWLVYGIFLGRFSIILANSMSLVLCAFVLAMKIRNRRNESA